MKGIAIILTLMVIHLVALSQDVTLDVPLRLTDVGTTSSGDILSVDASGDIVIKKYQVGASAHGGIIFYVDESGLHGLVADTIDLSSAVTWYNQSATQTNAISQSVGAGAMNTAVVSSILIPEDPEALFAALLCFRLDRAGYGDWYLPSRDELLMIYNNLHLAGLGNFPLPLLTYWSSSEVDKTHAHSFNFAGGTQESSLKDSFFAVRAIRSF